MTPAERKALFAGIEDGRPTIAELHFAVDWFKRFRNERDVISATGATNVANILRVLRECQDIEWLCKRKRGKPRKAGGPSPSA